MIPSRWTGLAVLCLTAAAGCQSRGAVAPAGTAVEDRGMPAERQGSGAVEGRSYGAGEGDRLSPETLEDGVPGGGTPGQAREELLSQRSIYFALDSDVITPEYQEVIEAHSAYLLSDPGNRVTLEGHADERGTREYNLALGERRAQSVKRLMTLLGVLPAQISAVSYGEERPYATGHDEQSWSLNRRVDLIY